MTDLAHWEQTSTNGDPGTSAGLQPQLQLNKLVDLEDLLTMRFHFEVLERGLRSSVTTWCRHDGELRDLVPSGFVVEATHSARDGLSRVMASATDVSVMLERQSSRVVVQVAATSEHAMQRCTSMICDLARIIENGDTIPALFWAMGRYGFAVRSRNLDAVAYSTIRQNYGANTRRHLDELGPFGSNRHRGGLVLWFGPPGTGKTTAVRALASAWRGDRELNVITDLEKLLEDADYLNAVTAPRSLDETEGAKLIVAEDVDPAQLAEHQVRSTNGLARLLGLTDGLLAAASDAIVLLTTNARHHQIAASLRRPGRCLALVEFGPLSTTEANRWLPDDAPPVAEPTALADLYHRAGLVHRIGTPDPQAPSAGTYL
ncbi:MAG: AAA family ATPase [Ilumatobacteraceae bacterium]|nr:AAA family ATPase [Ilumatobacteraceae bacterium]